MRFSILLALLLTACPQTPLVEPVNPPSPVPVVPVPPVPDPVTPAEVVKYEVVKQVVAGMTGSALLTLLGPPALTSRQDDGTTLSRWAAENEAGAPRFLDVQTSADGTVLGRALWPR